MKFAADGKKIMAAMLEQDKTAKQLADELGVTTAAVSNVIHGYRLGSKRVLPGICKSLGLKIEDVLMIIE